MGTGIKPCEATPQLFYLQLTTIQICLVDTGDFKLTALRRLDALGDLDDGVVIEIQPSDSPVRFRFYRFFFDGFGTELFIKFNHAKALGIHYLVTEYGGTFLIGNRLL
ncbi:hypothetical protein D3C73_756770 [compost metagenome]